MNLVRYHLKDQKIIHQEHNVFWFVLFIKLAAQWVVVIIVAE